MGCNTYWQIIQALIHLQVLQNKCLKHSYAMIASAWTKIIQSCVRKWVCHTISIPILAAKGQVNFLLQATIFSSVFHNLSKMICPLCALPYAVMMASAWTNIIQSCVWKWVPYTISISIMAAKEWVNFSLQATIFSSIFNIFSKMICPLCALAYAVMMASAWTNIIQSCVWKWVRYTISIPRVTFDMQPIFFDESIIR